MSSITAGIDACWRPDPGPFIEAVATNRRRRSTNRHVSGTNRRGRNTNCHVIDTSPHGVDADRHGRNTGWADTNTLSRG